MIEKSAEREKKEEEINEIIERIKETTDRTSSNLLKSRLIQEIGKFQADYHVLDESIKKWHPSWTEYSQR